MTHSELKATPKTSLNVAQAIISYSKAVGISHMFAVPGGAIEPLFNAIAQSQELSLVIARHESGAAFMADGFYRETRQMAIACATTGPGATNLITGVASAYAESIPMLVITAQTPLAKFGRKALQESSSVAVDTVSLFSPITVFNMLVSDASQLKNAFFAAVCAALRHKKPVHLSIPSDVFRQKLSPEELGSLPKEPEFVDEADLKELFSALSKNQKISLLVGESVSGAQKEIKSFIENIDCYYACTPMGKGFVDESHPNFMGVFGFAGHESAKVLLEKHSEVVICAGMELDELSTSGWSSLTNNKRVFHLNANPECFVRASNSKQVYGNVKTIFEKLNKEVSTWAFKSKKSNLHLKQIQYAQDNSSKIKPQSLMQKIAKVPGARYFIDAGNSWSWATHYLLTSSNEGEYRIGMGFGSMAWSIGASIGSAFSKNTTFCVVGDGSWLMSAQEMTVALQHKLPVVFIILNDSSLGMVYHGQKLGGQESIGWELPAIDFAMQAAAMGVPAFTLKTGTDLQNLDLEEIELLSKSGPVLIDARIDSEEVPPMGDRIKGISVTPGS